MTKEEVIVVMRECAARLGHPPSLPELRAHGVSDRQMKKHFLNYQNALRACGMEREGPGYRVSLESLFKDWAGLVRLLGKIPTVPEYELHSKYSARPLFSRFGSWRLVPMGLLVVAEESGWDADWKDVLDVIRTQLREEDLPARTSKRRLFMSGEVGILSDRPTYGPLLIPAALAHGPVNEAGVVLMFGMLAAKLGFVVTRVQTEFPDCEAMWEVQPEVWQRVRIEFEYESRNFLKHLHSADDCDLIVCWTHNWPECPLHVVELKKAVSSQQPAFSGRA